MALLVPLGLGETKVVLIMMPVVLFAAYFDLVAKRPLAFLGIVVATLFFGAILGYFYFDPPNAVSHQQWRIHLRLCQTHAYAGAQFA